MRRVPPCRCRQEGLVLPQQPPAQPRSHALAFPASLLGTQPVGAPCLPPASPRPAAPGQEGLGPLQHWILSFSLPPSKPTSRCTSPCPRWARAACLRPAFVVLSGWTGHPKAGMGDSFPQDLPPASESSHAQEGKKTPQHMENSDVMCPAQRTVLKYVLGRRTPHFSLNSCLNTSPVSPLTLRLAPAPQAVMLQQTIFFLVIISQVFLTPAKFLHPHIAWWCKQ